MGQTFKLGQINKTGQINKSGHFSEMCYEHLDLSSRARFVEPVKYGFDTAKSEPYAFASGICDFRGEVEINS